MTSADLKVMEGEIAPYWKTHALDANFLAVLRTAAPDAYRYAWTDDGKPAGVYLDTGIAQSSQNWTLDYDRWITGGGSGIGEAGVRTACARPSSCPGEVAILMSPTWNRVFFGGRIVHQRRSKGRNLVDRSARRVQSSFRLLRM